jgi:hypothetical protein
MHLKTASATGGALALISAIVCSFGANAETPTRCETTQSGVEYRAFLPDGKRYVYVTAKALSGVFPSIFVMVDKNYIEAGQRPAKDDPYTAWWTDRSKPMTFSTDKVRIRWKDSGTIHALTSWLSEPDWVEISQPIRGLGADGNRFTGAGSSDINTFAFQTRMEMPGFSGDEFDVILPSVSYDGATVTPPVVHFQREDRTTAIAKC